jgi:hypothetical protein
MLTVLLSREFAPHSGAGNLMRSWFRLGAAITSETARSAGCRHAQNRTQARTMARHTACANGMRDRSKGSVCGGRASISRTCATARTGGNPRNGPDRWEGVGAAVGTVALGWGAEVTDSVCGIGRPINRGHKSASIW